MTRIELDERGLPIRQVDALGGETRIERDACGRPVAVTRPDGSTIRMALRPGGQRHRSRSTHSATSRATGYAGLNKLAERTDAAGGVVQYVHDTEDDLIAVINEAGERYAIERDRAGRVVKERGFDGRALELWYDRAGRCREMVDAQMKRTKIERDALGRVVKQIVPRKPRLGDPIPEGEPYEYGYDALGGLVRAKNDACEVTFVRDALGRAIEERCDGHVVESRYDAAGDRVGRRTSLGHETSYDFDGNGALLGVTFDAGALWGRFDADALAATGSARAPWRATFTRDARGNETERRLPGGVVSRWEREATGRPRVQRVAHNDAAMGAVGYRWRSAEQLAGLIDSVAGPTWFEHDARGYLTAARQPDGSVQHRAPDAVGNVFRSADRCDRVYAGGGRLEEAGGVRYVHDADGQLVEKVLHDGRSWKYAWDLAGQLVEVTRPDGQRVSFAYDALGRRVRKSFAASTTRYVWDGNDLVHEMKEGTEAVSWVFEPGTFAPLAKIEGTRALRRGGGSPRHAADDGRRGGGAGVEGAARHLRGRAERCAARPRVRGGGRGSTRMRRRGSTTTDSGTTIRRPGGTSARIRSDWQVG